MTIRRAGLVLAFLTGIASLCACTPKAETPPVVPMAAAPAPLLTGNGCGPAIARTQGVVASDVATGNLNKPVGDRFQADLSVASQACGAGRDREAISLLAAAKSRYGYP